MKRAILAGVGCLLTASLTLAEESSTDINLQNVPLSMVLDDYAKLTGKRVEIVRNVDAVVTVKAERVTREGWARLIEEELRKANIGLFSFASNRVVAAWIDQSKPVPPVGTASYAERLKLRQEAREARKALQPPRPGPSPTAEELDKYVRQYNMDLIRTKGEYGPPLPIPLTEEEDAQLVKEGILPPKEKVPASPGTASTNRSESVREPPKP